MKRRKRGPVLVLAIFFSVVAMTIVAGFVEAGSMEAGTAFAMSLVGTLSVLVCVAILIHIVRVSAKRLNGRHSTEREHAHADGQGHLDYTCGTKFESPSCGDEEYDYRTMLGEGFEEENSLGEGFKE